jgi:hypothetical protein
MMRDLRRSAAEAEREGGHTAAIRALAVAAVAASRRRQGLCAYCPGCVERAAESPAAEARAVEAAPRRTAGAGPRRGCCEAEAEDVPPARSPWASPPRMPRLRAAPVGRVAGPFRAARHGG